MTVKRSETYRPSSSCQSPVLRWSCNSSADRWELPTAIIRHKTKSDPDFFRHFLQKSCCDNVKSLTNSRLRIDEMKISFILHVLCGQARTDSILSRIKVTSVFIDLNCLVFVLQIYKEYSILQTFFAKNHTSFCPKNTTKRPTPKQSPHPRAHARRVTSTMLQQNY